LDRNKRAQTNRINDKLKTSDNSKNEFKMQHKRLMLSAVILLGLGLTGLQAQESVNVTGGNVSGSGGSASYSVGQVVYTTHAGTNGSVTQGVQQPFEISVVIGIEEAKGISLMFAAYPNPTTDFLELKVDASAIVYRASAGLSIQSLSYQFFDISGKLLETKKLEGNQTSIVTSSLVPATYFLKVIQNNKEVKVFKIIKN
jgi:hypothetical protein